MKKALKSRRFGSYTLQAAIAAVHAEAESSAATDWGQIVAPYNQLVRIQPWPVVYLNRAVAIAMRDGPEAGLTHIDAVLGHGELANYYLAHSARADMYGRLGRSAEARPSYAKALALTQQEPERQFLQARIRQLQKKAEIKRSRGCRFSVSPTTIGQKNDELRVLSEQETRSSETNHREQGEVMPQYLVAMYLPDDYDPSSQTEATIEEIYALNREMIAAGVRKFACGLSPAADARSLRYQPDGKVSITDGPYTETKEHMGGLSVIEAADLDEAIEWARKGAVACRASGEVRPIFFMPAPEPGSGESK